LAVAVALAVVREVTLFSTQLHPLVVDADTIARAAVAAEHLVQVAVLARQAKGIMAQVGREVLTMTAEATLLPTFQVVVVVELAAMAAVVVVVLAVAVVVELLSLFRVVL
jgi:hypothetical protein